MVAETPAVAARSKALEKSTALSSVPALSRSKNPVPSPARLDAIDPKSGSAMPVLRFSNGIHGTKMLSAWKCVGC
jgi:hypothetical protein